jgi:hypothetical protein
MQYEPSSIEAHPRFVLVLYLVVAQGGAWILEQAGSSVVIEHDRAREFRKMLM